ncbi:hypothetical protein EFM34_10405 [Leuconostoc suionicum]|uniref:hypothetical protein n=1 Tax=Leuconostoc suionicum TaxID=1511761 RepID=UPI0021AA2584|nr:hypothetical protein [Leuconostoc suionicum]MCT4383603.1 hypothetical protein [Leuconostoc suionicum]
MALAISVLFNIVVIIIMILTWFKVPNMILEHYKSHLKEINQQKENEFSQKIQQQQHDFEKKLQTTLAENNQEFEQKADLLKQRRLVIPIIYAKLLKLNGMIRQEENHQKREVQIEVNNYIESQRLFLTDSLYQEIKDVQKSMNSLSALYETMPKIVGPKIHIYYKKSTELEAKIQEQLQKLELSFKNTMFSE